MTSPQAGDLQPAAVTPTIQGLTSVEEAVRCLLAHIGEDPDRDGLRDTPARVARSLRELTAGYGDDPGTILGRTFQEPHDAPVLVDAIPFASLCEHHMLPFHGTVAIAYVPDGEVVGLSKLARLVQCFARRLQIQERMTDQIADAIETHLRPRGVAVHASAEHMCMSMRGARAAGLTRTSAFRGEYCDASMRAEFLAQIRRS